MIGYYIHHQGRGHLHRALAISAALAEPVTGLSSLERPDEWRGEWVQLARDDEARNPVGATAGGVLHWAPLHDAGLAGRMAAISEWIGRSHPRAVVVDVSVEVALLCRLHGVPIVTVAMPGKRGDVPHALGYAASSALLGAWPASAKGIFSSEASAEAKVAPVGAISRFAGRSIAGEPDQRRVLVLLGRGGDSVDVSALEAAQRETPHWRWQVVGGEGGVWVDDPWELICRASVVVTHAGQNSVADVAAARRPAVILPQRRPHDEQAATARVLARDEWPAAVIREFPSTGWSELLTTTQRLDGALWREWNDGSGASRAAEVIRSVAGLGT
ncbi:MAG: glycosyl transferase [Salinibacterium sp.]|nr:glycosyltransferase [Salinibacterium sp.]MBF0672863.1 glycosyl transferase [Salinibacterium sp.]